MSQRDIADVLNYYGETNEFGLEDNPTKKHMRNGAAEIIKLRAENDSLKEVISLSEDSRLMDEYLKLERANARQAERIKEQEAEIAKLNEQLEDIRALWDSDQCVIAQRDQLRSTIERQRKGIEDARTALEETKSAEDFCRQYSHLPEATDDIADAMESAERKRESALAAIAELEKGVG